jgi:hypothetical protein
MKKIVISLIILTTAIIILSANTIFKPVGGNALSYRNLLEVKTLLQSEQLSIPLEHKKISSDDILQTHIFTNNNLSDIKTITNNITSVNAEIFNNTMMLVSFNNNSKIDYYMLVDRTNYFDTTDTKYNGFTNAMYSFILKGNFENFSSTFLLPFHLIKNEDILINLPDYKFKRNYLYETDYSITKFESFYNNTGNYLTDIVDNVLTVKLSSSYDNKSRLFDGELKITFSNNADKNYVSFNF